MEELRPGHTRLHRNLQGAVFQSPTQLPLTVVNEPRVELDKAQYFAILKGGLTYTYQQFSAPSNTSISSYQITANVGGLNIIVNRKPLLQNHLQLVWTSIAPVLAGQYLVELGSNDGFRQYPLASCMSNLQVGINAQTFTCQTGRIVHALSHFHDPRLIQEHTNSTTCAMADQYQEFSDAMTLGTARNPLNLYGGESYQTPRGGFVYDTLVNNVSTGVGINTASLTATLTEPFYCSPLIFGSPDAKGLIGVNTMTFQVSNGVTGSISPMSQVWCHGLSGQPYTIYQDPVITFTEPPRVLMQMITPDSLSVPIPRQISYPYYETFLSPFTVSSVLAPGAATTIAAAGVTTTQIPHRIVLWASQSTNLSGPTFTDSFAHIESASIQLSGYQTALTSATPEDLYQISVKNGVDLSWPQWKQYTGSVLMIDPSTDLGLQHADANGVVAGQTLNVNCRIKNPSTSQSRTYTFYVLLIYAGSCDIVESVVSSTLGGLTQQAVVSAERASFRDYDKIKSQLVQTGGNLFDFLDKIPIIGDVFKIAKPILGLGAVPSAGTVVSGGKRHKKHGSRRGGATMTMDDLEDES